MIGKNTIDIDTKEFLKGMSLSAHTSDGGFSPDTDHVNLTALQGVLNAPALATDKSTNLTENMIATCEDPAYLGKDALFLDDVGAFYSFNGTALTKEVTASGDLFTRGTTDFVPWYDVVAGTNFYATTKAGANGDIVKWNKTSTLTETWWSGAGTLNQGALSSTTAWRPLLVYEKYLFVGDRNNLHRISPDNPIVVSNSILSLDANESITALGIEKGSGYMLIATTTGVDYSITRNSKSKIYYYDGYSNKPLKSVPINGTVTAFKNIDDRTIVFVGNKIGYFTGSGIKFLRTLSFAIGDANLAVYPHRATVIENTIYFTDNTKIVAYGEVDKSGKVFYPAYKNAPSGTPTRIDMLANIGGGKLGFGYASSKFYTFDTTSVATTGTMAFITNKFNFPRPVYIREAYIEWSDAVANNVTPGSLGLYDETNQYTQFSSLQNLTGASSYSIITKPPDKKVRSVHFRYLCDTVVAGLRRIVISFDVAE